MNRIIMTLASGIYALSGMLTVPSVCAADKTSPSVSQSVGGIVDKAREKIHDLKGGSRTTRQAVDINTATLDELQNLPGVGRAHANRIIENRPYLRTDELLTKNIIPRETYNKFQDQIVASRTKEAVEEEQARKNAAQKKAAREQELRKRAAQREAAQRKAARAKAGEEPGLKDKVTDALKSLTEKTENK